jgi:DNA polymerase-3 subunit delta
MRDLAPENVLIALRKGTLAPFYLFYGPEDFWLEITLDTIKRELIPDTLKEFNLETLYGGEVSPEEILNRARLLPFMCSRRLIIVRGAESFSKAELDVFVPYLENPVDSACIIWVVGRAGLSHDLYKQCKQHGRAVHFKKLSERQILAWIQEKAKELDLTIERDAVAFLYQTVGNNLRDLHSELSKLCLRHTNSRLAIEDIKQLASFSRLFTVFDLVDYVSRKDAPRALEALARLFDTEGRDTKATLGILGMLARQMRLLLRTKAGLRAGEGKRAMAERLKPLPQFVIEKCIDQEGVWQEGELEEALAKLYDADGRIRIGSRGDLVVENLILRLCFPPMA